MASYYLEVQDPRISRATEEGQVINLTSATPTIPPVKINDGRHWHARVRASQQW